MKSLILALYLTSLSAQAAITIGGYNIRNFDYDERSKVPTNKPELSKLLTSLNADVLSVEEINNTAAFETFISTKLPGYDTELTRCGGEHGQRLGFVWNKSKVDLLSFTEDLAISEPGTSGTCESGSRPMAIGLFQIKATKQKFYGLTVHLKSGSVPASIQKRSLQYQIIKKTIQTLKAKTGVADYYVAGDFNTTEYLARGADYKDLTKIVSELGMKDLAANLGCTAYWWGNTDDGIETPSVLDHLIVTPGLLKVTPKVQVGGHCQKVSCRQVPIKELGISYEQISDHCPVTATIQ